MSSLNFLFLCVIETFSVSLNDGESSTLSKQGIYRFHNSYTVCALDFITVDYIPYSP